MGLYVPLLRRTRFSLSKDGNPILSDISFEVSGPGVLAIIGQSGTGKSTLLEVLTRQIEPRHVLQNDCVRGWTCNGEVHVAGQHIQNWEPTELRRSIGLVLQHPVMLPGSIDRNLSGILRAANPELSRIAAQNRAALALVDAGLGNEIRDLKRSAQALSGGQKQRLAIARAIQLEPAIICMDEPTSALDAVAALAIVELIKSLAAKRLVIVVTHDLRIAHKADRVILIGTSSQSENVGTTILKDGPAETVLAQSNEENSALFRADLALRSA